nr:MAG: polyprotein [Picornavirales sp.]
MTTVVASVTTRDIQEIDSPFNDYYMKVDIPDAYRVDAKAFIERPFYVDEVSFPDTAARYTLLTSTVKFLPGDIARSNPSVLNMFKMAAYGRPDLIINVSMAGTITHAGCILVGVLPPFPAYPTLVNVNNKKLINTILSGPHAFLYANEATSVAIPVPWFCNTDLATTDMQSDDNYDPTLDITATNGNYATLVYMVLNPLTPSTGSSKILKIIVEACFKNFDLAVPTPRFVEWAAQSGRFMPQSGIFSELSDFATGLLNSTADGIKTVAEDAIDAGRGAVKDYTGLHNPNIPNVQQRVVTTMTNFVNNTDVPQFFEKLDPNAQFNRIVKEPIFNSAIDEMSTTNITTKKQLIGTIQVTTDMSVGQLLWVRPISPFQGGLGNSTTDGSIQCSNNLELMHSFTRGWRGGLTLTIQSVMNNKQQCKLKVIKLYNPSVKITASYPVYRTVVNAPTHLLEFTQGGQEHRVELPYLCRNDITPCTSNTDTEAIFHGAYYIYIAQPLVVSDSSPTTIEFNIYLEGNSDLTFFGYTTANTYHDSYSIIPPSKQKFEAQSGTLKVMNEPQKQTHTTRIDDKEEQLTHINRLMPLPDIRSLVRRMYKSQTYKYTLSANSTTTAQTQLGSFLGELPYSWNYTPIETLSRMYYGKTAGFKFRAMLSLVANKPEHNNIDFANIRFYYLPQNINALTAFKVITSAPPNLAAFSSPFIPSDCVPLPFQILERESTTMNKVYEFVIPDTSFYKFMGSPNKFMNFDTNANPPNLSQSDFGTLLIQFSNLLAEGDLNVILELYVGLTDESRFGFHTMAPPFVVYKNTSYYLGINDNNTLAPTNILNQFTYRGGFL